MCLAGCAGPQGPATRTARGELLAARVHPSTERVDRVPLSLRTDDGQVLTFTVAPDFEWHTRHDAWSHAPA